MVVVLAVCKVGWLKLARPIRTEFVVIKDRNDSETAKNCRPNFVVPKGEHRMAMRISVPVTS